MKRYRLLKDLPTFKAGQLAYISEQGSLIAGSPDKPEITDVGVQLMMYHKTTLDKFPEILTEWFEEIKEPAGSIHWKPKVGDNYYYIVYSYNPLHNEILVSAWTDDDHDKAHYLCGNIYRSYEEAEKARNRKLAEVRLRRTSTFKPDFENGDSGWGVHYDHLNNKLGYFKCSWQDTGEPIRYKTSQEAEKSIKENRDDWLTYFGIKEEE
nr:MAG TPA: hypothetical protein [Caudoviricetes sp.]